MEILIRIREAFDDLRLYWRQPKPGEYVSYREIAMLSVGWMALYLSIKWGISFGVNNEFTAMTLHMNHAQLIVMGWVCQIVGYGTTALNAWLIDNLRSVKGKYRVYIQLAIPSMIMTLVSLWLPYEQIRDANPPKSQYAMIALLFIVGQVQGYLQGWVRSGVENMVHVITPNTLERTKIMSIASIVYSFGHTINNLYYPIMVDVLGNNGDKYNMNYFRGAYTPVALFMPIVLCAFFGTRERLVLPKSRITKLSFSSSLRAVAGNKIFWIKCFDGWNDFLEGAKGSIWDWMVYRAHIMKSSTYGILNTLAYFSSFWSMLLTPWFIKKFGKRKIKIFKNTMQIFLIASVFFFYKGRFAAIGLFLVNAINRFIDCGEVIDKAIEADMRDNQQYLIGERIDGSFNLISSYAGSVIGMATGLFLPWVYNKKGFDGKDYSVLDVYSNYDESKPLSAQTKNPNSVLFPMLDTLLWVSVFGAAVDVLPWLAYDITETGQKSMIRVIRIRTIVEDAKSKMNDDDSYIEGCEALIKAERYFGAAKVEVPSRNTVREAKHSSSDPQERHANIRAARAAIEQAREYNEEIEIADFVMHEIHRFDNDFGKKQLELCRFIVSGGKNGFFNAAKETMKLASELPLTHIKEERTWRKQEIRNARSVKRSARLAKKYYPDGVVEFDRHLYDQACNLPDTTKQEAAYRRREMKRLSKEQNIYGNVVSAYLAAERTLALAAGYADLNSITANYDDVVAWRNKIHDEKCAENQRILEEQRLDRERRNAEKRLRK